MRFSLAGLTLVAVVVALAVAVGLGVGHGPVPQELDGLLVELRPVGEGQPVVEIEDDGDGDLASLGVAAGASVVVDPEQLICLGGSITELEPGALVIVTGAVRPEGPAQRVVADRVEIDCG